MRKLGKRFDNVKETVQANSPCGNGCLCNGCKNCICNIFLFTSGSNTGVGSSEVSTNNNMDHD